MDVSDIQSALAKSDVNRGDVLFIHGDSIVSAQLKVDSKDKLKYFFLAVIDYLGKDGTLVIPSFTYSFTKNESFDVLNTKSSLGSFSEFFRGMEGVERSCQPIFSFCSVGKYSKLICSSDVTDCFGKKSGFGLLHSLNAKLMNLACPFEQTFLHYVEQSMMVKYRYFKNFSGKIIQKNSNTLATTRYFVGNQLFNYRMDLSSLKELLLNRKMLHIVPFGRFAAYTTSSKDFYDCSIELLGKNKFALIKEG